MAEIKPHICHRHCSEASGKPKPLEEDVFYLRSRCTCLGAPRLNFEIAQPPRHL